MRFMGALHGVKVHASFNQVSQYRKLSKLIVKIKPPIGGPIPHCLGLHSDSLVCDLAKLGTKHGTTKLKLQVHPSPLS